MNQNDFTKEELLRLEIVRAMIPALETCLSIENLLNDAKKVYDFITRTDVLSAVPAANAPPVEVFYLPPKQMGKADAHTSMYRRRWSQLERETLMQEFGDKISVEEIAKRHVRTVTAILRMYWDLTRHERYRRIERMNTAAT